MLEKLPTIAYNNVYGVTDITSPIVVPSIATMPYQMKEGQRADVIADTIYTNDQLDYAVLLANDIINPLDFVAPTYADFDQRIINQYGSIQAAQQQIMYWQNNWSTDQSIISVAAYNAMTSVVQQLYNPVRDYAGHTIGYNRKQINNRKNTSMFVTYQTANSSLVPQTYINLLDNTNNLIGLGRVVFVSNTIVIIDHVIGNYNCASITDGTNTSAVAPSPGYMPVISAAEAPYYSPVTVYNYLVQQCITNRETIQVYSQPDAINLDATL